MNENVLTDITMNMLGAWYLDLKFLVELVDEHKIDLYHVIDSIEWNFWKDVKIEINIIIYEVLNTIAYKFIADNSELFKDENNEFEIYTNYMDSHIYFTSEKAENKFEEFY